MLKYIKGVIIMKITVYGAASDKIHEKFKAAGETLGRKMGERKHTLIFGAGDNGMMGSVARGVSEKGGEIIGIAPTFFNVDGVLYEKCTKLIGTETMRERKKLLEDEADAFIITPGGVGTFDEFFEILTLKQLQQHNKALAIFNIDGYFNDMLKMMQKGADTEFISDMTLELYQVFEDADEMLDYLESYVPKEEDVYRLRNLLEEKK